MTKTRNFASLYAVAGSLPGKNVSLKYVISKDHVTSLTLSR